MNPLSGLLILIAVLLTCLKCVDSSDWPLTIMRAVEKRDKFLKPLRVATKATKTEDILKLIPALVELSTRFKTFHNVDFTKVRQPKNANALKLFKEISDSYTKIPIRDLSTQTTYAKEYMTIGFGAILSKFKHHHDKGK